MPRDSVRPYSSRSVVLYTNFYTKKGKCIVEKKRWAMLLPMLVQRNRTLKGLIAIFTFDLRSRISMRTFMTAEIGKLSVWFRTKLEGRIILWRRNVDLSRLLTSHFHGLTLEWIFRCCFKPEDVWKLLPQSSQEYSRFSHSLVSLEFVGVLLMIISVRSYILQKKRNSHHLHRRRRRRLRSEVVKRRTFLKLKFDWLNMNR